MAQAQAEFYQRRFPEALQLYRNFLRAHPQDQDAWTRFAATYYHTGQAKQALSYLQKSKPSSNLKGFNLFYQALCYDALGDSGRAKRYLARVAQMEEPLAEDALFELAALEFEDANAGAARLLTEHYLHRFKDGRFRSAMESMSYRLSLAGKISIEGTQHARYQSSFFSHHPLSLMPIPHIWFYQLGYFYESGKRSNPAYGRDKPVINTGIGYEEFKLNASAGIGLGPFKGKGTESYAGYIYQQEWVSDGDRLKVWTEDFTDIEYFPFRPDLMERRHRLYVETFGQKGSFLFGTYAHWQFHRAGSEFFPAPERPEIRKAFDVGTETLFVPWIEWNYLPQQSARAYFLFKKFIDREQTDFSNKTYNLFSASEAPFLSLTLEHNTSFPDLLGLKLSVEAFQHQYVFNDFWESYTSRGGAVMVRLNPWSFLAVTAKAAYTLDAYTYDFIRSKGCSDSRENAPAACPRVDKTLIAAFSLSYITAKQQALSVLTHYSSHTNDTLKVYDQTKNDVLLQFTQAFPTLNLAGRYIEPFQGIAKSKGVY